MVTMIDSSNPPAATEVARLLDLAIELDDLTARADHLRAERDQLAAQLHQVGYSWRTIAAWAGTSHVALQKRYGD